MKIISDSGCLRDRAHRQGVRRRHGHCRDLEPPGTMDEEFLFWDNRTFYGEMGLD
jgi:hypothetical protein